MMSNAKHISGPDQTSGPESLSSQVRAGEPGSVAEAQADRTPNIAQTCVECGVQRPWYGALTIDSDGSVGAMCRPCLAAVTAGFRRPGGAA
jgi:hypothetical protein